MNNYNEMIGGICHADAGDYTIVAHVHDDGCIDQSINLYVGRAADGHHDMIASDNASMWVVGDEDNHGQNRDQWDIIEERCDVAPVLAEVRKVDAALADWLTARYDEARRTVIIYKGDHLREDCYNDGVVVAPIGNLAAETIKAIWADIPRECILEQGLGSGKAYAHLAPVDGNGDPRKDIRSIEGYEDCKAAYYVAPWDAEDRDGACDMWDLYNADGTPYICQ